MESKINFEWIKYYKILEDLRKAGKFNMYAAGKELSEICKIDEELANQILVSWMSNYSKLAEMFNWQ